jgi:hypothetical protein
MRHENLGHLLTGEKSKVVLFLSCSGFDRGVYSAQVRHPNFTNPSLSDPDSDVLQGVSSDDPRRAKAGALGANFDVVHSGRKVCIVNQRGYRWHRDFGASQANARVSQGQWHITMAFMN